MLTINDVQMMPSIVYKTPKIRVLLVYIVYPLAMGTYFKRALERRDDVDLKVSGPYTSNWMPWLNGLTVPMRYAIAPDIPLSFPPNIGEINYESIKVQLGDWIPDIIINVDAGIHFKYKPQEGYVVHVATDPHALNYDYQRGICDKFFNMQLYYSQKGDIYLPYAYDVECHRPDDSVSKDVDAVRIGMPYPHRVEWENKLKERGVTVLGENGPIFEEARQAYNRGKIGLNWSSMNDLNARAFELPAMKLCPVMNIVTDIPKFFTSGFHYLGFENLDEAIENVVWAKNHPDDVQVFTNRAYQAVQGETYDARVQTILRESGFV